MKQEYLGRDEQCMVTIETKKGNRLLFMFMRIPNNPKREYGCYDDYEYEFMNMETGDVFCIDGVSYDKLVKSRYFFNIKTTDKYLHLQDELTKKSFFNFILTCNQN